MRSYGSAESVRVTKHTHLERCVGLPAALFACLFVCLFVCLDKVRPGHWQNKILNQKTFNGVCDNMFISFMQ